MKIGFSFSPGGLLLPYHLGILASLSQHGHLTFETPLAGSSAGAIAVAAHAAGVDSRTALEAAIRVSTQCHPGVVATGRLLPLLRSALDDVLPLQAHEMLNHRAGPVALAYREVFPRNRSVLQTRFATRESLMDAICDSSMFPYFLTNQPVRLVQRPGRILPRMVVDGVFACAAERIGCPDFDDITTSTPPSTTGSRIRQKAVTSGVQSTEGVGRRQGQRQAKKEEVSSKIDIDRTVMVSVFPTEFLSLTTSPKTDQIGPALEEHNLVGQATRLVRMATQASSTTELRDLYQQGYLDAETWAAGEDRRNRMVWKAHQEQQRREYNKLAP